VEAGHKVFSFGYAGENLKIISREAHPKGQKVKFSMDGKEYEVTLPLVGDFQVMNALCAFALVRPYVDNVDVLVSNLEKLSGVPGRLQLIDGHPKGAVYVDYAHKPAALETILKTLREHTIGQLVCVFGCGGNRDKGKRPIMGKIAHEFADKIIVTDDNPRYENAEDIRKEIMSSAVSAIEIADREKAIERAVSELGDGDILVVAGKGHEEGQIVGEEVYPFNDAMVIEQKIGELK